MGHKSSKFLPDIYNNAAYMDKIKTTGNTEPKKNNYTIRQTKSNSKQTAPWSMNVPVKI